VTATSLDDGQLLDIYEWMKLTRLLDGRVVSLWKQGRGVGGTFSERGHEAISVGAGYALEADDVVATIHRDLGCYLLRGMSPARILANQFGRATGVSRGRDANIHGMGDLSLGIIGFVSHLPQSMGPAVGAAMAFTYRNEPRVAMTFVGDGSSSAGVFHEALNLAAVQKAPFVVLIENNQYAYSTPLSQ
jgi:TPP-dependent pyruvate/acetoin dehydrogenase alpha subunit